ncbi:MAG: DUF6314 family protein [Pseudomonadota bacterium]
MRAPLRLPVAWARFRPTRKKRQGSDGVFNSLWDFEGTWQLDRTILHRAGPRAQLTGQAVLTRAGQGLDYYESGVLSLDGQAPVRAERRYLWRPGDAGDVEILFEDGRAFHTIVRDAPRATHECAPDTYEVEYDFSDWPDWQSHWEVTGPWKAYSMASRYSRVPLR